MGKIGRNDPCPCGSGKKYKKCCNGKSRMDAVPDDVKLHFDRIRAKQLLLEKQQGHGKSIISTEFKGYRMVAVGKRLHYSTRWKTFHDFLTDYIKTVFGKEWGLAELAKPFEQNHPLVQWQILAGKYLKEKQGAPGGINSAPMSGAIAALMYLSYNLYLLEHNVEIQSRLVRRLKDKNQFRGALYETYVAAEFIKAGFSLEIENEEDSRTTHCEFTAISNKSGRKYSIEAKARQPHKVTPDVHRQLSNALNKAALHERMVFIDVNITDFAKHVQEIVDGIKQKEESWVGDQKAYVFVTNHPFEYELEGPYERRMGLAHGFRIPDFSFDFCFSNIRDVLKARENHQDAFDLIKSFTEHDEIPSTFDGEHPEFSFADKNSPPRLIIGNKYLVPDGDGKNVGAVLESATVSETEKSVYGVYHTTTGRRVICTNSLTDEEMIAYHRQPDTFFGVPLSVGRKSKTPLELFDFFYDTYRNTSKEKILEWMKDDSDFYSLERMSEKELQITYCERLVFGVVRDREAKKPLE